ncbi:MAG: glycosyltransferase family 4 protein [Chlamydiota bacterium]|nr:glycosyltransferase family 4 protein [Chlamydiota bacterium]
MNKKWRIAFVIPRFGVTKAGGAETLVEALSVRLGDKGHKVEVLTTCAQDHETWQNDLDPGEEHYQQISVHRFEVDERPDTCSFGRLQNRIERRWILSKREQLRWIQGSVQSRRLYQHIQDHQDQWDFIIFAPYLFGITYFGARIVPRKSILIPCLHPEPYAELDIFSDMFHSVCGIICNAVSEKELVQRLFHLDEERCRVVGMGFDVLQQKTSPEQFREKFGLGDDPVLLYAGRKEKGKNIDRLLHYFSSYKKNKASCNLKLVFIGSGMLPYSNIPDVYDLGYVSEQDKMSAYHAATMLCQPSINESFSIVVMEAWLAKLPVLVNADCAVTQDHVMHSQGGLVFRGFYEFEAALTLLLDNKTMRSVMGDCGNRYVLEEFNWETIISRFEEALEHFQT